MKKPVIVFCAFGLILFPVLSFGQTIALGESHSLAICNDSTIMAWGEDDYGELGNGNTNYCYSHPIVVNSLSGIIAVSCGAYHSIALRSDSTVWAWGLNGYGQLGIGTATTTGCICKSSPMQVIGLTGILSISAGSAHTLALKYDGSVWAWGLNWWHQLGVPNSQGLIAVRVDSISDVMSVLGASESSAVIKKDSTVWGWGSNSYGQLGNGTYIASDFPVQMNISGRIKAITAGDQYTILLKSDSTVWACGRNDFGQLGNGTNSNSNIPVQINTLTGIISIASGRSHSLALKNDGTVWAWGKNSYGELGNGTNIDSNIPVQVNSITNIRKIAAGGYYSMVADINGTVWAWGENYTGQLGNGTVVNSNVPVQVIGLCPMAIGIGEIDNRKLIPRNQLIIFANPNKGTFNIKVPEEIKDLTGATLVVNDNTGKEVTRFELGGVNNNNSTPYFDVSNAEEGAYTVKLITKEKKTYIGKLVVE